MRLKPTINLRVRHQHIDRGHHAHDRDAGRWRRRLHRPRSKLHQRGARGGRMEPSHDCLRESVSLVLETLFETSRRTSSQKCSEHALSDKRTYPTFARTIPPTQKIAESIIAVLKHYDWRRIVVVAGKHLPMFSNVKGRMCSIYNGSIIYGW